MVCSVREVVIADASRSARSSTNMCGVSSVLVVRVAMYSIEKIGFDDMIAARVSCMGSGARFRLNRYL